MKAVSQPLRASADARVINHATSIEAHPYRFLGAFRFLLALLVLVSHAAGFIANELTWLSLGNIGVLLFFVVSGFVICEALDIFYRESTAKFLLNRAIKIFPAYWAILPLAYAITWVALPETLRGNPFAVLVNVSLLLSYLPSGGPLLIIPIAWAIMIEFQFYLVAAAVSLAGRVTGRRAVTTAGAAVASLGLYLLIWRTGGYARFYGGFQFAPFFVFGSLTYFLVVRRDLRTLPLFALAFALMMHAYYLYNARGDIAPGIWLGTAGTRWNLVWSTFLFLALSGLFVFLVSAQFGKSLERIDKRSGDITYALYLVHTPLILLASHLALSGGIGFAYVLTISLIVAMLIQRAIERPIWKVRDLLRGRRLYD